MRRTLWIFFAVLALSGCGADEPARTHESGEQELFDQRITFQQVLRRLRDDDDEGRVSQTVVELAPMIGSANVRELLRAVWEGDRASFPDLNWAVLEKQRVRIAVARVLGRREPTDPRYRDYALHMSEHAAVVGDRCEALLALGYIGRAEDLVSLQSIAVGSNTLLATAAMAGLVASQNEEARQAVARISVDPATPQERRKFASDLLALPPR